MVDPSAITQGLGNAFAGSLQGFGSKFLVYFGYFVYMLIILGIMAVLYAWVVFKYKVTIFEGSIDRLEGNKCSIRILRTKRNRARALKDKGIDKWQLLFGFKKLQPIPYQYIQPGNHVFLFKTGMDTYNPVAVGVGNPSASFVIDPYDRSFFNLGVQQDARDYQKDDVAKKQMTMMIVTIVLCLAAVVFVTWLTMKSTGGVADKLETVGNMLSSRLGAPPG